MDRIEFFQSVDQNRAYDSAITSLFDQFSALYDLVGQYNAIKISNTTEKNKVQFDLKCIDYDQMNFIYNQIINRKVIYLYGCVFEIAAIKKDDNKIRILFSSKYQPDIVSLTLQK